jgi:hypothetical protein
MTTQVPGACLCGAVTFSIGLPSLWCAHCHCTMCQRAHGAAFVTWVGVPTAQFHLDQGADLQWFLSSHGAGRGFCRCCGASMLFRSERWPGEMHVTVANLMAPIDRAPQAHVFYDTHVDWVQLGDSLPRKSVVVD